MMLGGAALLADLPGALRGLALRAPPSPRRPSGVFVVAYLGPGPLRRFLLLDNLVAELRGTTAAPLADWSYGALAPFSEGGIRELVQLDCALVGTISPLCHPTAKPEDPQLCGASRKAAH